jgi:hypothetical protein
MRLERRARVGDELPEATRYGGSQCFGSRMPPTRRREPTDYLGALSAGVILIILAITYLRYPIDIYVVVSYFESLIVRQRYVKPPLALFDPAIFFFNVVGVWSLVLSGLRIVFQRSVRRAVGDFAGALFSFFFAFLLREYANNVLRGQAVLAYFIVAIGLLVIVNAIVSFAYKEK